MARLILTVCVALAFNVFGREWSGCSPPATLGESCCRAGRPAVVSSIKPLTKEELPKGSIFGVTSPRKDIQQVLIAMDARHVAVQDLKGDTIWDLREGRLGGGRKRDTHATLAFSSDARTLHLYHAARGILAWDWKRDKVVGVTKTDGPKPLFDDVPVNGYSRLLGERRTDETRFLRFRDPSTGRIVGKPFKAENGRSVALAGDGLRVAFLVAGVAGKTPESFVSHDLETTKSLHSITEEPGRHAQAGILTNGRLVGTINHTFDKMLIPSDPQTRVWEFSSGHLLLAVRSPGAHAMAISPDGRIAVVAAANHAIRIWDLAFLKEVGRFDGPDRAGREVTSQTCLGFSADGMLLASVDGSYAFLWDLAAVRRRLPALPPVKPADAPALWKTLASDDAKVARRAVWRLAASPDAALGVLAKHLRPIPSPAGLPGLLRQLDDDDPDIRDAAERKLAALREMADTALRAALADPRTPAEARQRLRRILVVPLGPLKMDARRLQTWRAIEVLERIGGDEAMRLLRKMAGGHADAGETMEALTALRRLDYARRWNPRR